MKIKPLLITSIMSSILATVPTTLMASEAQLKVAILDSTSTTKSVSEGEYKEIIANLSTSPTKGSYSTFERNNALCVAYLKTNNITESEAACSAAIKSAKTLGFQYKKSDYLKSISYSNRAVARFLKDDVVGAMSDLAVANAIDSNQITKVNLEIMNAKLEQSGNDESISLAD